MSLQKAFAQSRKNLAGSNATPRGNLILKATEFTDKTVKGEVMTGPAAGQEIEIKVPDNGGKSVGIKEFTKKSHKAFVDTAKGGTLRVEGVRQGNDGVYDSRWMRSFNGQPDEKNQNVRYDALVNFVDTNRKDGQNRPIMNLHELKTDDEAFVQSMDELKAAVQSAFEENDGVHLFVHDKENGEVATQAINLGGEKQGDDWVRNDPAERAEEVIASYDDFRDEMERILGDTGISVVPSERLRLGPDTAENIVSEYAEAEENGKAPRISTVDPESFKTLPIGVRLQIALSIKDGENALPKDANDKLKAKFLETADEGAKEAFHKNGWRGVSNDDMRRFFASQGVELGKHPEEGWSRQTVLCIGESLAVKSFATQAAQPYPNVKALEEAAQDFRSEMTDAARQVVESPNAEAGKSAEAKSESPKDAADEEKKQETAEAEKSDLDDMLNDLSESDLDEEQPA